MSARRHDPLKALERRAGLRRQPRGPRYVLDLLERMAELEIAGTGGGFRARQPVLDPASLHKVHHIFGEDVGSTVSPAALRMAYQIVGLIWQWGWEAVF